MRNKKINNRRLWICLAVVFVIGVVLGCRTETASMQNLLLNGTVLSKKEIMLHYLMENGLLLLLCWGWGYFLPLLPVACLAVGYKAFSVTSIAVTALHGFGARGFRFYLAGVLPHNGVMLFLLCMACVVSGRLPYALYAPDENYRKERCIQAVRLVPLVMLLLLAAYGEATLFVKALQYLRA